MTKEGQIKIIYKRSLYEELVKRGHKPFEIEKNYKNNNFYVYKFIKDKTLAKDLEEIFNNGE